MKSCLLSFAVLTGMTAFANSPYITKIYEFRPAPGQFLNELPEISASDTESDVCSKVLQQIGNGKNPGLISLGAFGGYVVFGFDHPVVNVKGEYDFKIYGNAVISDRERGGGSCEPGIVLVSSDVNKNGLPDDPWYELAGSEYYKNTTKKNIKITYHKPDTDHKATPDPVSSSISDTKYIRWSASDGTEGYITKNTFHQQSYWPEWIKSDKLEFSGTMLAPNGEDISGNGSYFVLKQLDWGYADNRPNNDAEYKGFDISWAVDADGNNVQLSTIDFVKVHTAVNQCNGWIGENSTEVAGAEDLHPDADPGLGVEEILTAADEKPVFDLFGRRIAKPLPGQIYVRGGKKYILK